MTATASTIRYAAADPTLPKPWKGLVDSSTGYLYFWNPETNVTQYQKPTDTVAPPKTCLEPVKTAIQVESPVREQSSEKEDQKYGGSINADAELETKSITNEGESGAPARSHHDGPIVEASDAQGGSSVGGLASSAAVPGLSVEAYRRRHEISVTGDNVPPPFMSFDAIGLPSEIIREVVSAGFSAPTPIQAQSWPIAIQSRDIVAIAKTGSGKTLGYLIPSFVHLKRARKDSRMGPSILVLSPTRELATQIQAEAVKFGRTSKISCVCLYGGAPKNAQIQELDRGADIVVATPGRLNDILEMKRISLHQVSYLVLDEADRMLDMGFEPQIMRIVKAVPSQRQTLMYTATWPKEVRKIAADLLKNPVQVNIGNVDELVANKSITQHVEVLAYMDKHRRLEQILSSQEPGSKMIVFCATKKMCDQLSRNLNRFGAAAIHGDKSQSERDYVLNQFRSGRSPVLVATDVAARGLDVKDIRVVVNYDFPTGIEDYVHRIGRTGRAGATGEAYTFFGDNDAKHASSLIKILEGANQNVPPKVRELATCGGGMGGPRRWDSSSGGRSDSGYGGRGGSGYSSSYGGRGGGRGYDNDSRDRYDGGGYNKGQSSGFGDSGNNVSRERSRSPPNTSDGLSFHERMMRQSQA